MDKCEFDNKIIEIKKQAPVLFGLGQDNLATAKDIATIEKHYDLKLPQSYIEFVKQYGGGYFGTTVILSCDPNGEFYILENISKTFVKKESVFPVIDFETGDYLAYVIEDGICKEKLVVYLHEEDEKRIYEFDFNDAVIEFGFGHLR